MPLIPAPGAWGSWISVSLKQDLSTEWVSGQPGLHKNPVLKTKKRLIDSCVLEYMLCAPWVLRCLCRSEQGDACPPTGVTRGRKPLSMDGCPCPLKDRLLFPTAQPSLQPHKVHCCLSALSTYIGLVLGTHLQVHRLYKIKSYLIGIWGRTPHHLKIPGVLNNDDVAQVHVHGQCYTLFKALIKSACLPQSQRSCVASREQVELYLRTGQRITCGAFFSVGSEPYSLGLHLWENAWVDTCPWDAQSTQTHACVFTNGAGISSCPQRPLSWNWPESLLPVD